MYKNKLLLFFLLLTNCYSFAQDYDFSTLSVEDGLSQSSVTCIAQDEKGFMWIGTRDGLNYYDGHDVKVFRKIPFDSSSLISNYISFLLVESSLGLWVGTKEGLQWYDAETRKFQYINLSKKGKRIEIISLYKDHFGGLWVGTRNGFFLVKRDSEKNIVITRHYFFNSELEKGDNQSYSSYSFLHDRYNGFWVSTNKGLFKFSFNEEKNLNDDANLQAYPENYRKDTQMYSALFEHADGHIYATVNNEIRRFDKDKEVFTPFFELKENEKGGISQLSKTTNGQLVAVTVKGIQFLSLAAGEIISSNFVKLPARGISDISHRLNFFHEDIIYRDLYWLATDLDGVLKMHQKQKQFQTQFLQDVPDLGINNPYLRDIVSDEKRTWINLRKGILINEKRDNSFQYIDEIHPYNMMEGNGPIQFLYQNHQGKKLIGLSESIIEIWIDDKNNFQSKNYPLRQNCIGQASGIFETARYYILGGLLGNISVLRKEDYEEINCIDQHQILKSLGKKEVTTLLLDDQSNLWLGTFDGLLVYLHFDPESEANNPPQYFRYNPLDTSSLIENNVTHIMQDSKGTIWISTRNGLMTATVLNQTIQLQQVDVPILQNQVIYGILEDTISGQFWMSTNSGLYSYDPSTGNVNHFNVKDGLQSNEFNTASFFQSTSGELFFGGPKGFSHFMPGNIKIQKQAPPTWFTELKTFDNKRINLLTFDKEKTLLLDYKQRSFSISFIGLDFFQPEELHYFYELEGTTSVQEAALGTSRQIHFSELRPGDYSLHIKAVNKFGVYSQKGDTLHFTIRAPFWKMTWFYLLLVVLIVALFWLVFYLRYQNKMNQLEAIESVRKSIAEDFHDELGSKLSIISMYSEFTKNELSESEGKAALYLEKVSATAARLYDSTRDLIWVLNPKNDTLYDLYFQLKDFGEELFRDTDINFHSEGIPDQLKHKNLPVRYKRHLLLIFKEAMHNALKHSTCENISISIGQKGQVIIFALQDDGQGFDADSVYKGDGLKNMRHRAKQIGSELKFTSGKEGTKIWLAIK